MTSRPKRQITIEALRLNASPVYRTITELEAPIMELQYRARIMFRITGDKAEGDGVAIYLGCDVDDAAARLSEIHGRLFRMTHPIPEVRAKGKRSA